jgi:hypothetical protein
MKKLVGIVLLVAFLVSFGAGYLLSLNIATAGPCNTTCVGFKCPLNAVCKCDDHTGCCKCVRFVG